MLKIKKLISLNNTKNKYLVLDTETIHSGLLDNDNNVIPTRDIIEISWVVLDCDGVEISQSKKGFIVQEFWDNKSYLLSKNYEQTKKGIIEKQNFAINKISHWQQALRDRVLQVKPWSYIIKQLNKDLKNYDITLFSAYNIAFDRGAIYSTSKLLKDKTYNKIWEIDFIDIMELVKVIVKDKNFKIWSENHNSITPKGNYKTSAEALYRYLTNNSNKLETVIPDSINWSETHLAIEDIICEALIIQSALTYARRKRDIKVNINCYGGWSSLNKIIKSQKPLKVKNKQLQLDIVNK